MEFYFLGGEVWCDCTEANMQIEGGHYKLTKQLMKGSMLIYNCPEGYYPYPALTRLCQPNGTWRPAPKRFAPQKCRSKWCEDVSHFVSGCLLYMITKTILFCFAVVECPDPNVLEYGDVFPPQEKYFVDNETTYECYSGYTLRGSSRRVCLQNGKWSGSTPICSRDSKSKQQSSFFVLLFSLSGLGYTLIHDCFMPFVIFITTAGDHCADPGVPAGASRTGNIFGIGDTIKYSCNSNLFLMGSSERVCLENGQWTGTEPSCYCESDT